MDLPEQVTDNRGYFYFICTLGCHNLLCFNRPILIIKICKGTDFDCSMNVLYNDKAEQTHPGSQTRPALHNCQGHAPFWGRENRGSFDFNAI